MSTVEYEMNVLDGSDIKQWKYGWGKLFENKHALILKFTY